MKCEKKLKNLSAYADGELEQAREEEIKEHLKECSTCRENLEEYEKLGEILKARRKAAPALNFEDRVLAKIKYAEIERPFPVFRLALCAAMLLIAVFGYRSKTRYNPSDILISDSEIAEIENETIALFYNGDA